MILLSIEVRTLTTCFMSHLHHQISFSYMGSNGWMPRAILEKCYNEQRHAYIVMPIDKSFPKLQCDL